MHIAFSVLALVTLYRHRPYIQTKTLIFVIICGGLFAIDKHFRVGRYAYLRFFRKTTATFHPLSNGGTRIVLNQSIHSARAGLHARLWIPKIRKLQTHPMTMASTSPVTFVISAQTGFTAALHKYAVREPGATLKATFDGPYGTVPLFDRYDTTILVAGGGGAAWTFAVCMDLLVRNPEARIEFVWVVRTKGTLSFLPLHKVTSFWLKLPTSTNAVLPDTLKWFQNEIQILKTMSQVHLSLHVTNTPSSSEKLPKAQADPEMQIAPGSCELFQAPPSAYEMVAVIDLPNTQPGRPVLVDVVRNAVVGLKRNDRAIVGVCGPMGMIKDVTKAVVMCNGVKNGPLVNLHTEEFGW